MLKLERKETRPERYEKAGGGSRKPRLAYVIIAAGNTATTS